MIMSKEELKKKAPKAFDQLAELHMAGLFAEADWRVYFPHRDDGFDFIATKQLRDGLLIRPVQVKGKYPEDAKKNKATYGYVGTLSQTDPEMVLAIPFFSIGALPILQHVAFMPFYKIKPKGGGYRCEPAKFTGGKALLRGEHAKYFDHEGLKRLS
jgi:hypothetical protein